LNTFTASLFSIFFLLRTNSRSPDHLALLTSRSANRFWKSSAAFCSASGLSAENRGVRMIMPSWPSTSISETSKPSSPDLASASRTLAGSILT